MFLFYLGMSLYQIDDGFFLSLKPELSQILTKTFKGHLRPSLCLQVQHGALLSRFVQIPKTPCWREHRESRPWALHTPSRRWLSEGWEGRLAHHGNGAPHSEENTDTS